MQNLSRSLDQNRRDALRNSDFLAPDRFEPSLIEEGEDYILRKGAVKPPQGKKSHAQRYMPYPQQGAQRGERSDFPQQYL